MNTRGICFAAILTGCGVLGGVVQGASLKCILSNWAIWYSHIQLFGTVLGWGVLGGAIGLTTSISAKAVDTFIGQVFISYVLGCMAFAGIILLYDCFHADEHYRFFRRIGNDSFRNGEALPWGLLYGGPLGVLVTVAFGINKRNLGSWRSPLLVVPFIIASILSGGLLFVLLRKSDLSFGTDTRSPSPSPTLILCGFPYCISQLFAMLIADYVRVRVKT